MKLSEDMNMDVGTVKTNKDFLRLQFLSMMQTQLKFAFYAFIEHHPFSIDSLNDNLELRKSYYDSYCNFAAKFAYGYSYDKDDFFEQLRLLSAPPQGLEVELFFRLDSFNSTVLSMLDRELNKRVANL
jgi:hypothetical protein